MLSDCTDRVLEQMTAMVMCRLSTRGGERWHEQREAAQEEEGRRRKKGHLVPRLVLVKDD